MTHMFEVNVYDLTRWLLAIYLLSFLALGSLNSKEHVFHQEVPNSFIPLNFSSMTCDLPVSWVCWSLLSWNLFSSTLLFSLLSFKIIMDTSISYSHKFSFILMFPSTFCLAQSCYSNLSSCFLYFLYQGWHNFLFFALSLYIPFQLKST